jgi:hypothetical protein
MNGFYFNLCFRQDLQEKQDIIFTRFPLAAIACRSGKAAGMKPGIYNPLRGKNIR